LTRDTAAVVMTHNYLDDVELLRALLPSPAAYVGLLGPKQRTEKLLAEIRAGGGCFTTSQLSRLHGPVGIDIGAETPEEIALSVGAEIKAACEGRRAGYLRDRDAPIHDERAALTAPSEFKLGVSGASESAAGVACGLS
ncbi:MAG TPA: XdhC family protein, partial [Pyrinomonadaceae bacterium]|nr:XdhC family protein [Pyrinomonadaceae bacterium]